MIRTFLLLLLLLASASLALAEQPRPNIILVMADDLGWGDTGFNGNTVIKTPHLDAMAKNGTRLSRFYAAARSVARRAAASSPAAIPSATASTTRTPAT